MSTTSISTANLDIGRVIQTTFGVIGRNFAVFALLSLCFAGIPALIAGFGQMGITNNTGAGSNWVTWLVASLVQFVALYVLQGALTHGTVLDLNGRKASFLSCLETGLRNALPLVALGIVTGIALVFGFIFLIVPGLMMLTAWAVTVPAMVVERRGVFEAFTRSADLTRGQRWSVFGLIVLYIVASWILGFIIAIPTGVMAATTGAITTWPGIVATAIASVLQGILAATGGAVLYFELRRIKEGVGHEELAAIFD
jgi:hypothetical protein